MGLKSFALLTSLLANLYSVASKQGNPTKLMRGSDDERCVAIQSSLYWNSNLGQISQLD